MIVVQVDGTSTTDKIKAAYERGKQEGTVKVQSQLSAVTKEMYANIQGQLNEIEKEEKEKAKKRVLLLYLYHCPEVML